MYYMLYKLSNYRYNNIYYVGFIYYKGLKYIRKKYNEQNIHFSYKTNYKFFTLKYYSMFFNIL